MKTKIKSKISIAVARAGRKGVSTKELAARCRAGKGDKKAFYDTLYDFARSGAIVEYRGRWVTARAIGAYPAEVVRLNKTFGFVRKDDGSDVFVAGRYLQGAMTGDRVLVKPIRSEKGEEGKVIAVLDEKNEPFTGVIVRENGRDFILPDSICNFPLTLARTDMRLNSGDKVVACIEKRGQSHREHRAIVTDVFGRSDSAQICAAAMVAARGISADFPNAVNDEAAHLVHKAIPDVERAGRTDFTRLNLFTIDSAHSKDLDDAVSLEKMGEDYLLGVHIADVSHYVRPDSELDREAFARGTSIYYADQVIPMLPKALSNGICSLNPNEERLAFSAILTLDKNGNLIDYDFKKSVISSRVKGVYSEINAILDHTESDEIREKYSGLYDSIFLMDELADKLIAARIQRGAPEIDTVESAILTENGVAVDVKPRVRGKSERIIEEFMLLANRAAAMLAKKAQLPFVYRVHETPSPEKIEELKVTLRALGIDCRGLNAGKNPSELSGILQGIGDSPMYGAINRMVVRSMAKAKYAATELGHYGLALEDYAHFTSPIRRYPDLAIHRILTAFLESGNAERITKRYGKFASSAADRSTETELAAVKLQRECEDCYKAEYMQKHVGETFEGTVSSVTAFGFFVELESTVEGLVSLSTLPEGQYVFDGGMRLISGHGDIVLGDRVQVKCVRADVNSGQIDFELIK